MATSFTRCVASRYVDPEPVPNSREVREVGYGHNGIGSAYRPWRARAPEIWVLRRDRWVLILTP